MGVPRQFRVNRMRSQTFSFREIEKSDLSGLQGWLCLPDSYNQWRLLNCHSQSRASGESCLWADLAHLRLLAHQCREGGKKATALSTSILSPVSEASKWMKGIRIQPHNSHYTEDKSYTFLRKTIMAIYRNYTEMPFCRQSQSKINQPSN